MAHVCHFASHQAAAKQRRSSTEHELLQIQDSSGKQSPAVIKDYLPQGITEPASSEESLKEITPTTPRLAIQQPASVDMATTLEPQHAGISTDQYGVDTSLARPGPSGVTFDSQGEELVPTPRKKKKRKVRVDEGVNTGSGNNDECELVEVVTKGHEVSGENSLDAAIPKKKKKKKAKSSAPNSLPPVIVRRPLPQLQLKD